MMATAAALICTLAARWIFGPDGFLFPMWQWFLIVSTPCPLLVVLLGYILIRLGGKKSSKSRRIVSMDAAEVSRELEAIREDPDFAFRSSALVDAWGASNRGVELIEPVLRFMESHPEIDYGAPGALVHFVERFDGGGYEQLLLDSLARRPTPHTAWMLNRLIDGTQDAGLRRQYEQSMEQALTHPRADADTVEQIRDFLA